MDLDLRNAHKQKKERDLIQGDRQGLSDQLIPSEYHAYFAF